MLAIWNIFFCLLFKCILATGFFDTVTEWIKDLLNFLAGMILWRRLISLLPQIQFSFCVTYEIMRNIHQSNGEKQWHGALAACHNAWVNKESHLLYL